MMQALRSLGMLAVTVGLALGSGSSADAGLIPWSYNALFGYGPAYPQYAYYGGYGYGYDAGPVTYSASYGGYTSNCCGQAVTYYGPAPAGCCGSCNSCGSCGSCGTCATGNCGSCGGCSTCGTNYGGDCSSCGGAGCSNCAPSTSGSNLTPQPDNGPKPTLADPPRRPGETDQFNPAAGTGGRNPMGNPYGGQNTAPPPAGNYNPGAADPRYNGGANPGAADPRFNGGANPGIGTVPNNNTGAGGFQPPTNLGGGRSSIPDTGGGNNILGGPANAFPRGAAPAEPGGAGGNAPRYPAGDNPAGGSNLFNGPNNNNGGGEIEGNPLYRGTDPAKQNEQGSIPISDGPIAHSYDAHRNRSVLVAPTHTLTVTRVVIRGAEPTSERIAKK